MSKRIDIRGDRGQAMVEFALVLPVLVFILFGIIQFGIAYNNYVTLTDAVRAGGRQATVSRFVSDPIGATTATVLASANGLDTSKIAVKVTKPDGSTATWNHGDDVTVTATYPYSIDLLGIVEVSSGVLSSSATEKVE